MVLVVSWKREIVGGVGFIAAEILYRVFAFGRAESWQTALLWSVQIAGATFVIGGFFLVNRVKKGK